jgi:hypothetical protein
MTLATRATPLSSDLQRYAKEACDAHSQVLATFPELVSELDALNKDHYIQQQCKITGDCPETLARKLGMSAAFEINLHATNVC